MVKWPGAFCNQKASDTELQEATNSSNLTYNLKQWLHEEFLKNCVFQHCWLKSALKDALDFAFLLKLRTSNKVLTTSKLISFSNTNPWERNALIFQWAQKPSNINRVLTGCSQTSVLQIKIESKNLLWKEQNWVINYNQLALINNNGVAKTVLANTLEIIYTP